MKRVQSTDGDVSRIWEAFEDARYDGFDATFEFDSTADMSYIASALGGETDLLRSHQPALFDAIRDVDVNGRSVELRFTDVGVPALYEDGTDHEVACFLYSDELRS